MMAFAGLAIGSFLDISTFEHMLPGLFVATLFALAHVVLIRRGLGAFALALAVAVAVVLVGQSFSAFLVVLALACVFSIAGVITVAGDFFGAFAFAVALGVLILIDDDVISLGAYLSFTSMSIAVICATFQLVVGLSVRRRALRGATHHAWARQLAIDLECLGGTRLAGADLRNADFKAACLRGADLRGARLRRTRFRGARELEWARFDPGHMRLLSVQQLLAKGDAAGLSLGGMRLRGTYLRGARLTRAHVEGIDLSDADLGGADLRGAILRGADLRGTVLVQASLEGADLADARIDALTYQRSDFTPDLLVDLYRRGIEIIALETFPRAAQDRLAGEREGLLLCFDTRLSAFDKMIVEGMIVGVLGRDTDCYVAEYRVQGETAIVRLCGSCRADLERVAEALYLKVWQQVQTHQGALVRMADVLLPGTLKGGLDDLFGRRLARMELRDSPTPPPVASSGSSVGALVDAPASEAPGPAPLRWAWQHPALPGADKIETATPPRRLFVCYAPADLKYANELCINLSVLHRQGLIETFRPEDVLPGHPIADTLTERLDHADIVVCLVSASFLAHDECVEQMERALRRSRESGAPVVVPVLARPSDWRESQLGALQPLPENGQFIAKWPNEDDAWLSVTSGLRRLLLSL
ncbi:toll/interleukin-1 receptor domain-containing protein [Sorangium sp. So ce726]|uniref:toll/interleukin-1 receptor domain-containing protein n=1 Tax=Sorangium sp. So ce726 TaxID=3133319 RepID=UPI003F5ED556